MPYMFLIDDRARKSGDTTIWTVSGIELGGMYYRIVQRSDPLSRSWTELHKMNLSMTLVDHL
jgi:hypothetical protein